MALPVLAAGLLGVFAASAIRAIVARVLGALGFGIVSYVGVTAALNQLIALIHTRLGGVTSDIFHLVGMAGFDVFLSLVISARFGMITFLFAQRGWRRLSFLNNEAT